MLFLYKMLVLTVSKLIRHSQKQPKNVACSLNEQIWNLALFLLQNSIGMLLLMPSFLGHKSQISVSLLSSCALGQHCGQRGTACVWLWCWGSSASVSQPGEQKCGAGRAARTHRDPTSPGCWSGHNVGLPPAAQVRASSGLSLHCSRGKTCWMLRPC